MKPTTDRDLKDLAILSSVICLFAICLLFVSERQKNAERDFVYFYSVGRIAKEHSPKQIYDLTTQRKTFDEVYRLKGDRVYGPSPYPPFVPLFFGLFSPLSFQTAYYVWQLCSVTLFCCAVGLLAGHLWPKQRIAQSLLFTATISFSPFLADTLAAGQLTAIGLFAFAVALYEQGRGRDFRSGLALSLALYKPTLLLLLIPMLLVRRQWRTLGGLMTGGAWLFIVVTIFMGLRVWTAYAAMLVSLGRLQGFLDFSRYVDLLAFSKLLAHNHRVIENLIVFSAAVTLSSFLIRAWLRSRDNQLICASTITCTLFLNVYVPIYDCALVIPSIIVSAPVLLARDRRLFTATALLLYGCSWITELIARTSGIQIVSVAVVLLAFLQIRASIAVAGRTSRFHLSRAELCSTSSSTCLHNG